MRALVTIHLRSLVLSLALSLVLGSGLGPSPARAQDDAAEASALFREATRAFSEEDYLEALRLFRAAYDVAPHPTVRFHIAQSLERLGRLREAWSEMTEVAATAGLTDAQRRDATRQVERLRGLLVTLRVEGTPAGAGVRIDDAPMCTLPCEIPIDPGDHEVVIEDGTGRASTRVSGLRGATLAVRLTIVPEAEASIEDPEPSESTAVSTAVPTAEPSPEPSPEARGGAGVGWLLVTGSVLTALGAGGLIGFGLHATELHGAYLNGPTPALRSDGMLFVDLTNASIGVLAGGALLVLIDVALALAGEGTGERTSALEGMSRF